MPDPYDVLSDPPMRLGCPTPGMCDELMICHGGCAAVDAAEEGVFDWDDEDGWMDEGEG
jgi:hypothetical protein